MLTLKVCDPAVRGCWEAAVENLRLNTVRCEAEIYNSTGLLTDSRMLRAGGCYETPWTRDAAVNTWNAGRFFCPETAKNTLLAVCVPDGEGRPIIQPDNQKWDRIVWSVGAWQYWLATGDREFLAVAEGIVDRALKTLTQERFNGEFGLFTGGSFFNDGISGYPAALYEPGMDSSFVGDHPKAETVMCLSTNLLYREAFRILSRMRCILGKDGSDDRGRLLEANIRKRFAAEQGYAYLLYPDGRRDEARELSGHAFAVLFGVDDGRCLDGLTERSWGIPSIWPPFPGRSSVEKPARHNNLIWPFLNSFYIRACAGSGRAAAAWAELERMTALFESSGGFYEIYNPETGAVDGGWQIGGDGMTGHQWDSCRDQTWSATGYLAAIIEGVFGVRTEEEGLRLSPCVPEKMADSALEGLTLRGQEWSIRIHGWGSRIRELRLNNRKIEGPLIPWGTGGAVEVWME